MEELYPHLSTDSGLRLHLPIIQISHYLCTVRTSAFGFVVPLFLILLTICANRITFGIFHGSFAHIFAIYISCLEMLEFFAEECQKLVDDTIEGRSTIGDFAEKLRSLGVTSSEGRDYVEQLDQRIYQQKKDGKRRESNIGNEESIATSSTQPTQPTRSNQIDRLTRLIV